MASWEDTRDQMCDNNNRLRDQICHVHECVGAAGKALDDAWAYLLKEVMTDRESVRGGLVVGVQPHDLGRLCNRIIDLRAEQEKLLVEVAEFWNKCGGPVGSVEVMMMLFEERVEVAVGDVDDDADAADVAS